METLIGSTPIIWAIGGIDNLGVAGLLADSRAANATAVHCATIVTCVTAQNSETFRQLKATEESMLEDQWRALEIQTEPKVIKIGLIANQFQALWLGNKLTSYRKMRQQQGNDVKVIYDPVFASSSGRILVDEDALAAIKQFVLPQVDLLTPNTTEASILAEISLNNCIDLVLVANKIVAKFGLAVLVKGGHLTHLENAYDCYVGKRGTIELREAATSFVMKSPKLDNTNLRGTGCNLASLIASHLAMNHTLCDALVLAKSTINQAISVAKQLGNNKGGLTDLTVPVNSHFLPYLMTPDEFQSHQKRSPSKSINEGFAPCEQNLGLYPVVSSSEWIRQLLNLGVKTIQLRIKDYNEEDVEPAIVEAIALGSQFQARIFINDFWQLAIKHQAYGVHLGQEDLQTADLNQIKLAGLRLGVSTHGIYEAVIAAQLKPSYIALGHIYPTKTKHMPSKPQGMENLAQQVALFCQQHSLVAIGGINCDRVNAVVNTGIGCIAVVTAISEAEDVAGTVRNLLDKIGPGDPMSEVIARQQEVVHE